MRTYSAACVLQFGVSHPPSDTTHFPISVRVGLCLYADGLLSGVGQTESELLVDLGPVGRVGVA